MLSKLPVCQVKSHTSIWQMHWECIGAIETLNTKPPPHPLPAGAPSVVNKGGAVGATDLLKTPEEVYKLDLALPMPQLAHQVGLLCLPASSIGTAQHSCQPLKE